MKKFLATMLSVVMLLSLVSCGNNRDSAGKSKNSQTYKDVIEEAMKALIDGDEDELSNMYASLINESYAENEAENQVANFESRIFDYGVLKSWEIVNCREYNAEELADLIDRNKDAIKELKEALDDGYIDEEDVVNSGCNIDFIPSKIKGCVEAEIEIVVDADNGREYTRTIKFILIKEVSTWKIVSISHDWFLFFEF